MRVINRQLERRIDEIEERFPILKERRDQHAGTMSGGQQRMVEIGRTLMAEPTMLLVDEPTAGLDPEERVRFRNLLSDLAGDRIVILSTHIVSDAEAVANRIAVIHQGHLLVRGAFGEGDRLYRLGPGQPAAEDTQLIRSAN